MEEKHKVIYYFLHADDSDTKITQQLSQKDLGKLLLRDDVVLSSVNAESKPYYRRKKKGR